MSGTKKRAAMLILVGPNPGCRRDWVNGRLVRGQSAQTHPDESTLRMPPALGLLSCRSTVSPRAAARRAAGRFEHAQEGRWQWFPGSIRSEERRVGKECGSRWV